jgi:glutamine amidotransferase
MARVAIIDYGVGNLRSVEKAFEAAGCDALVSSDPGVIREAERLVLPGVGAFANCMNELSRRGLDDLVLQRAMEGAPLLGVCVGMQMLFEESEEFGLARGLGLLPGRVRAFKTDLPVPHVGWNLVRHKRSHFLFDGIQDRSFFYFVHSFFCEPADKTVVIGETEYGAAFASIVAHKNISGVQFHPEKSQRDGLRLLRNFATAEFPIA